MLSRLPTRAALHSNQNQSKSRPLHTYRVTHALSCVIYSHARICVVPKILQRLRADMFFDESAAEGRILLLVWAIQSVSRDDGVSRCFFDLDLSARESASGGSCRHPRPWRCTPTAT